MVIVSKNADKLAERAAKLFVFLAKENIKRSGRFSVVLSGGSTPEKLFRLLAASPFRSRINWKKVFFFFGDERCVPPAHKLSNYRMAKETLFSKVPVPSKNIFRMRGELAPARGAKAYEESIRYYFDMSFLRRRGSDSRLPGNDKGTKTPVFDLIFLGLGADGHTASLFPKTKALHEKKRLVVPNVAKGTACLQRVTLTFPAINAAKVICFLAAGKEKAPVLRDILKRRKNYPAQHVSPKSGELFWMVDREAVSR